MATTLTKHEFGNGWAVYHLSDRVVELRKESYEYRLLTGRDGFVRVRGEPGIAREALVRRACDLAHQNDDALAVRMAKRLAPDLASLAAYQRKQVRLAQAFATPEEPETIGVKR